MPSAAPSGHRYAMKRGGNGVKQEKRGVELSGDPAQKPGRPGGKAAHSPAAAGECAPCARYKISVAQATTERCGSAAANVALRLASGGWIHCVLIFTLSALASAPTIFTSRCQPSV